MIVVFTYWTSKLELTLQFMRIKLHPSYELCHSCLGHVANSIITLLSKLGLDSLTSLFPSPKHCNSCNLAKSTRLPFNINDSHVSKLLDLIHYDLWGLAPVTYVLDFASMLCLWMITPDSLGFYHNARSLNLLMFFCNFSHSSKINFLAK